MKVAEKISRSDKGRIATSGIKKGQRRAERREAKRLLTTRGDEALEKRRRFKGWTE